MIVLDSGHQQWSKSMRAARTRSCQRGAVGLYAALVLLLTLLFAVLAVDSARLWMSKRQLQKVADIAAIEASRGLACNATLANVTARAQAAAARNGFGADIGAFPNRVETGTVTTVNGRRQFISDGTAGAVHVVATQNVPASLIAGGLFNEDVEIHAEAVSLPDIPVAAFAIGSTAATMDTTESSLMNALLGGMLGTPINLSLVSYQGLANTDITIAKLMRAHGGALDINEFLNMDFRTDEALRLISTALGLQDDLAPGVLNDTVYLANSVAGNTTLRLGQVLHVNEDVQQAAVDASVNLLSLLSTILMLSNGQHAIALPLDLNVLGLASASAYVTVIEAPRIAIGPPADDHGSACTYASSAQVRVDVTAGVNLAPLAEITLALSLEAARADAALQAIEPGSSSTDLAFNASSSLVTLNRDGQAVADIRLLSIIPLLPSLAKINLNVQPNPVTTSTTTVSIPRPVDAHLPLMVTSINVGSSGLESVFSQQSSLKLSVLGLGVFDGILNNTVRPLLVQISRSLLDPLLRLLGIRLNGTDILIQDVTLTNRHPLVL